MLLSCVNDDLFNMCSGDGVSGKIFFLNVFIRGWVICWWVYGLDDW